MCYHSPCLSQVQTASHGLAYLYAYHCTCLRDSVLLCGQANNAIVKTFGEPRPSVDPATGKKLYNHVDLVQLLGIVNLEAGQEVGRTWTEGGRCVGFKKRP